MKDSSISTRKNKRILLDLGDRLLKSLTLATVYLRSFDLGDSLKKFGTWTDRQTNRHTDRLKNLLIEGPFKSLKRKTMISVYITSTINYINDV